MGIDSIGKKGPPVPPGPPDAKGSGRPTEASRPFEIAGSPPATQAAPVEATRTALERLRAGEIDVKGYVDIKVDEATAHLRGLPPADLEHVRASLRDRLATDPGLVDLVHTATGSAPPIPTDD